ncbi:CDP-alcohol phosphatidyltransferase family protein [Gordonia neofelifaecis]|uniref:CDP-diacylglycerol--glycerol-3-phosphate 3-phosphatidyltransferase n=1 Tax=Gordonia neofelifaecis NRRL B-59395 TaxID=644548 RepID=F1YP52_9ACTN|nr:CDP-alcohol phosphatidyltransferase family protein [Gordonia neofelifaecis]EGD53557.1 CDP-diacylglycerol--glycerol-3-phosphate 3-phosphatidyltransferase [Gordonia neofelifaecis NRRL B-59395]
MTPQPESQPGTPQPERSDAVWTVPNALSVLRLLLIPVFIWLLLVEESAGWAFVVLFVSGLTDWLDGKLARWLGQSSKLGALLDPAADRLYVIVIPICFGIREFVPWWLIGLIIGRDLLLFATAPLLKSRGITALPTLYVGKAATFALMSSFPWLLAGQIDGVIGTICYPIGWAFLLWGVGLYLWSLVLYWIQTVAVVRRMPRASVTA